MKIYDLNLILASGSPRRAQILSEAGFNFTIKVSDADESFDPKESPPRIATLIAEKKAETVAQLDLDEDAIIIAADSIVVYKNDILEKPIDESDAFRMLKLMSDDTHQVYTGVCLKGKHKTLSFASCSEVLVYPVSSEEMSYYINNYQPFDKAGAYGIQEWFGMCKVKEIKGSHFNIMGLPIAEVYHKLHEFIGS